MLIAMLERFLGEYQYVPKYMKQMLQNSIKNIVTHKKLKIYSTYVLKIDCM